MRSPVSGPRAGAGEGSAELEEPIGHLYVDGTGLAAHDERQRHEVARVEFEQIRSRIGPRHS